MMPPVGVDEARLRRRSSRDMLRGVADGDKVFIQLCTLGDPGWPSSAMFDGCNNGSPKIASLAP